MKFEEVAKYFPDMVEGEPFVHPHLLPLMEAVPERTPAVRSIPKVGRNQPCPECLRRGKSVKFKHCKEHFGSFGVPNV